MGEQAALMETAEELYVSNRNDWRAWLKENHDAKKEVWLIYYKKHTGRPSIPYEDQLRKHCVLVG
jgi:uncharacterized protein YdeI (YjbR/CyaY-like superfamily)